MTDSFITAAAREDTQRRAQRSTALASDVDPVRMARARRNAQVLGMPADVIYSDPSYDREAQTVRNQTALATAPKTAAFLADENNAAVAHDQVEPLSFLERTTGALKFGLNALAWQQRSQTLGVGSVARRLPGAGAAGVLRTSAGVVGLTEASNDVLDLFDPILAYERMTGRAGIATQAQANRVQGSRQFRQDITASAGRFNPQTGNFVADAALQGVESVVPSLTGMALAALTGGTAAPVVASAFLAAPQGGTSYAEARDAGRGVGQSLVYGVAQGTTEYAGERLLGAGKLVERLALGQPLLRSILRNQLEEQIGEQATTVIQDLNQWATINPDKPFSDYLKERPNAALQTAIATAVGTAVTGGVVGGVAAPMREGMTQEARATDAVVDAKAFSDLEAQVSSSELMTRAPDALRGALDQMLDGKTVFVPGEKVVEFFQSNPDLDQWLDEWDIRDQVEQAAAAGTDVAFSQSDYLVRVAPTAAGAAFKPDLRFAIGAMSEREAADRAKAQQEGEADPVLALLDESIAKAQAANNAADPVERVQADVFSKLRAAGTTVDVAREQSAAVAARSQARAERRADRFPTAWDAYQANPLDVTQVIPERVRANMGRADVFLRALRKSRAAPTQRRMLGRSLNEFLSANGGVYDAGGDLASMGLDQWHRGRPGVRKLLSDNNGSNGLDYALTRAIEGGYLRADATVDDLTAAMGEELRGRPTYSQGFERDLAGEENAAALNDFEQVLNTMGVDLSKETDAEVKAKLDKLANAVDGGETLIQGPESLTDDVVGGITSQDQFHESDDDGNTKVSVTAAEVEAVRAAGLEISDTGLMPIATTEALRLERSYRNGSQERPVRPAGSTLNQMAGVAAATAPLAELDRAKAMEEVGELPTDIWEATGWGRGDDNQWRFEISDEDAKMRPGVLEKASALAMAGQNTMPLSDVLEHDALYAAYPALADMPVAIMDLPGSASGAVARDENGRIIVLMSREAIEKRPDSAEAILIHEVQHLIQHIEGFAIGASSQPDALRAAGYGDALSEMTEAATAEWEKVQNERRAAMKVYRRSAGEIEARNTEKRRGYSADERRMFPPNYTRDIAQAEAIVRFDSGGQSLMVSESDLRAAQTDHNQSEATQLLEARGFDTSRVFYHQTAQENVDPIERNGFDISKGLARLSDPHVPDGVFFKPDQRDIGVGSANRDAAQIPVYLRMGKTLEVADRAALVEELSADPEYARMAQELDAAEKAAVVEYDEIENRWDEVGRRIYKAQPKDMPNAERVALRNADPEYAALDKQTGDYLAAWKERENVAAAALRERATTYLRDQGYETVRIAKDEGGLGRSTETIITIGGDQVASTSTGRTLYQSQPVAQTETPEFKAWFGESKVVDADGKPLVVYHGTAADFEAFNPALGGVNTGHPGSGLGVFLTARSWLADQYASIASRGGWQDGSPGNATVYPVYVAVQNPKRYDTASEFYAEADKWAGREAAWRASMEAEGFDGVIVRSDFEEVVAFAPTQIKSATGNRGTFDANDPRIMYQNTGAPRGSISFTGNRQIITLMATADKSTFLHESGHAFLQELDDDARFPGASQQLIDDHNAVFEWFERNADKLAAYATTQAQAAENAAAQAEGRAPVTLPAIQSAEVRAWSDKRSMSAETSIEAAIYTAAHEQWAETFEEYLMTGKSPSIRLRGSFERFSLWLKAIYNGITRTLPNAVITDDIRGVMDRLLATDEEIATARATMGLAQELEGMRGLMTPEAFSAFADAVQRAADVSRDDLLAQTMKAVRREKTAEWNALAAEIRPDIEAEVDAMPDIAAVRFLRENGQGLGREFVVAMLGNEAGLALLPKGVPPLVRENGLHPDVVAEAAGYPSGVAMLNGLMDMQAEKVAAKSRGIDGSVRSTRISDRIRETLLDRYGDILNDGTIAEEALAALHNEKQGEVNQIALTVLGRRVGQSPSPLSVLRAWARRHIGERPISAARPDRFLQAERKAANAAAQAIAKDDRSEAYRQKQQQQANFVLYAAARQAREDVDKAVSRMMKLGRKKTIGSMDQDYLDQIHEILSRYDLSAASAREVQGRIGLAAFVKEREAAGDPIQVPARLLDQASKRHYSTLTVDEIRELDETIQNLAKLGRLKQTLLDGKARRDAQALADEAVATAEANLRDKPRDEGVASEEHWLKRSLQAPANFEASMVRIQAYFDRLQGGYEGVFTRVLDVPGQIAYETLTTLRRAFWNPVKAAERAIPDAVKARWFERLEGHPIINPETGQPMTTLIRQDLIGLARHVGSASNFEKLSKGWGFVPREADEFAVENARQGFIQWLGSEMDASEWSYVEAWWEAHDAQREDYFNNERELTGIRPVAVEAAPFEVAGRKFKGGYAPISYDHRFDQAAAKRDLEDAADPFGGINRVARTSNGSAQDRTAYIGPVDFGMKRAALDAHTQMVRIAYGQYVESGVKFLAHKDVQQVIINKLGRRAWSNMNEWLAGQVKDTTIPEVANREAEGFMRSMRSNVAIGSMLFSATTMISQLAGMAQSIAVVGLPTFLKGQALSMSLVARQQDPMAAVKFIIGKSSYMDSRLNEGGLDRDVRAAALAHDDGFRPGMVLAPGVSPMNRAKLALDTAVGGKNNMAVVGGWMIGAMDLIGASGPAWMGVYDNEIAQGVSEADAVRKADNAVISAQGGSRPIDRAPIMRAKGIVQNFTMFFGWANAMYNIKRGAVLNIRDGRDRAHHVAAVGWLLIASPLFDAILGDDWPDDWTDGEELFKWFFRNVLFGLGADIPLVRDVASVKERESQGKYGGEVGGTAVARLYQNGDALMKDLSALMDEDKDVSKRWPAHIINGIGFSAGIPGTTAASRATSYGIDVANGEQEPETIGDWLNGLARGPREDQK